MTWSIQQVARMSGVTARTLRYYDELGLLLPDAVGANGYRYYERAQVLRLQHILLLREFGLDLTTIKPVVDAERDPIDALRRHHRQLLTERGRLDRLAETVAATIEHLEKGTEMAEERLFDGFEFGPDYIDRELERTHHPELAAVKQRTADWSEADFEAFNDRGGLLEIAEGLVQPSEWRSHLDSLDPRLAAYLRDAMFAYANARM